MSLSDGLKGQHTHAVEELLNHRLLYDLKLAATESGYHLLTYYSDVDHDGFDVILDDRDNLRKIQLKTVSVNTKGGPATQNWDVHKPILRPSAENWELFGFYTPHKFFSESPFGVEGGVILMQYRVAGDDLAITYLYTDIYVISAIVLKLISRPWQTVAAAKRLRTNLMDKDHVGDTVSVSRGLFVEVASPQHLLALLGLKSVHRSGWHWYFRALAMEEWHLKNMTLQQTLEEYRDSQFPAAMQKASGKDVP